MKMNLPSHYYAYAYACSFAVAMDFVKMNCIEDVSSITLGTSSVAAGQDSMPWVITYVKKKYRHNAI